MASIRTILRGLEILAGYSEYGLDSHDISAEHDVIYGPGAQDAPTLEERAELDTLGWFWSSEGESWAHFV